MAPTRGGGGHDQEDVELASAESGGKDAPLSRRQATPAGGNHHHEHGDDMAGLDDASYFSTQSGHRYDHASLKSFFLRLLPNRTGNTRTFFWDGLMWLMEIPPYLEVNIARKIKKWGEVIRREKNPDEFQNSKEWLYRPQLQCLKWGKEYVKHKDQIMGDLMAGLTIGVMLIPQSMAYALLANMPPIMGLYTACIAPIFYALLGTSMHLQIGPTSLISLFLPGAMEMVGVTPERFPNEPELDAHWKQERVALAPVLAFWVGILYVTFSITRAGNLIKFLSHSVMVGFTSAAGLYIGISQLKFIFGVKLSGEFPYNYQLFDFYNTHGPAQGSKVTQNIGGLSFLFMYLEKFLKRVFPPTPKRMANKYYKIYKYVATFTTIFVVIITAAITKGLYAAGIKIPIVGSLPPGYPPIQVPAFHRYRFGDVIAAAFPLAILGYMEAYSVSRKYALQFKYTINPDQGRYGMGGGGRWTDLFALGMGNLVGSFVSSYPTSGNFGRTALASVIGQRTPTANLIVALFISLVLVSLLPALHYIPFATLGAVVCNAVVNLIDWPEMIKAFFLSPLDCFVMLVTFFVTLFVSIEDGLGWGLAASVICLFFKLSQVDTITLGCREGSEQFVSLKIYPQAKEDPKIKVLRISGRMAFMNATVLRDTLIAFVDKEGLPYQDVVFDCAGVSSIDLTAIIALLDIVAEAEKNDIQLYVANVCKQLKSNLTICGLIEKLGGVDLCVHTVEEVFKQAKLNRIELDSKPKVPKKKDDGHGHH